MTRGSGSQKRGSTRETEDARWFQKKTTEWLGELRQLDESERAEGTALLLDRAERTARMYLAKALTQNQRGAAAWFFRWVEFAIRLGLNLDGHAYGWRTWRKVLLDCASNSSSRKRGGTRVTGDTDSLRRFCHGRSTEREARIGLGLGERRATRQDVSDKYAEIAQKRREMPHASQRSIAMELGVEEKTVRTALARWKDHVDPDSPP
jgi:hypothetical protein